MLLDALIDALFDSLKLLPFLFLTYLVMEYLEKKAEDKTQSQIKNSRFGPFWGGLLGIIPQCGFSAAASSFFAGRLITVGTLLAVYLSTSDEMLPILISEAVPLGTIVKILTTKCIIAIITGVAIDLVYTRILRKKHRQPDIHSLCEQEHCHCDDGILKSAILHTVKIFLFILLFSFVINLIVEGVGPEAVSSLLIGKPLVGVLITALIGLIPNCASSVAITQMYLSGIIGAGALISGLLVAAGTGLLILFRLNKPLKDNLKIVAVLYLSGVIWGTILSALSITF